MAQGSSRSGESRTRRAIVKLLKTEGALDSARLAKKLRVTPMAVRQHLYALQKEKMVNAEASARAAWPPGQVLEADA